MQMLDDDHRALARVWHTVGVRYNQLQLPVTLWRHMLDLPLGEEGSCQMTPQFLPERFRKENPTSVISPSNNGTPYEPTLCTCKGVGGEGTDTEKLIEKWSLARLG